MARTSLRIGLIGAGDNTRQRHIPGLQALPDVEIVAVCNRRPESTEQVRQAFGIARGYEHWQDVIAAPDIDAIVIGTWPYLHCPITLAALAAGKHVLTEARMALNAEEAHRMWDASKKRPDLACQIVPSPYGFKAGNVVRELLDSGYLGELRDVQVYCWNGALADPALPLPWRQDAALSGFNMLALGILHETLLRWVPPPVRVLSQVHAFIGSRIDPQSGVRRIVGTPDSVQVLTVLQNGARAVYQLSGVAPFGQSTGIRLLGSDGALYYDLNADRLFGASRRAGAAPGQDLAEIKIDPAKAGGWRVEADFIAAIRDGTPITLTDFATGVAYMEFTEAVARSAQLGEPVDLPLPEFADEEN
jgi:predicted dehydrogenase